MGEKQRDGTSGTSPAESGLEYGMMVLCFVVLQIYVISNAVRSKQIGHFDIVVYQKHTVV